MNLALRFILEICVLMSFGYWGFVVGDGILLKITIGIGTPLVFACIWAIFGSPKASIPAQGIMRLVLELAFFGLAALALVDVEKPVLAMALVILVILNRLLLYMFDQ